MDRPLTYGNHHPSTHTPEHAAKRTQVYLAYLAYLALNIERKQAAVLGDLFVRETLAWKTYWEQRTELKWAFADEFFPEEEFLRDRRQAIYDAAAAGERFMIVPDRTLLDDSYDAVIYHR